MTKKRKQSCNPHSIICHGKTEKKVCQRIMRNNRLRPNIFAKNNGNSSVQINGLLKWLKKHEVFKTKAAYMRHYNIGKSQEHEIRIFIIMDLDDCKCKEDEKKYINGEMFNGFWAKEYIVPIYWNKNFEQVCKKVGIDLEGYEKPYTKLFERKDDITYELLKKCKNMDSNIIELISFAEYKIKKTT